MCKAFLWGKKHFIYVESLDYSLFHFCSYLFETHNIYMRIKLYYIKLRNKLFYCSLQLFGVCVCVSARVLRACVYAG